MSERQAFGRYTAVMMLVLGAALSTMGGYVATRMQDQAAIRRERHERFVQIIEKHSEEYDRFLAAFHRWERLSRDTTRDLTVERKAVVDAVNDLLVCHTFRTALLDVMGCYDSRIVAESDSLVHDMIGLGTLFSFEDQPPPRKTQPDAQELSDSVEAELARMDQAMHARLRYELRVAERAGRC
jgi:hypothetical protein